MIGNKLAYVERTKNKILQTMRNWHFSFQRLSNWRITTNWQRTDKLTGNLKPVIDWREWHMLEKTRYVYGRAVFYTIQPISRIIDLLLLLSPGRTSTLIGYISAQLKCQFLTPVKPTNNDRRTKLCVSTGIYTRWQHCFEQESHFFVHRFFLFVQGVSKRTGRDFTDFLPYIKTIWTVPCWTVIVYVWYFTTVYYHL